MYSTFLIVCFLLSEFGSVFMFLMDTAQTRRLKQLHDRGLPLATSWKLVSFGTLGTALGHCIFLASRAEYVKYCLQNGIQPLNTQTAYMGLIVVANIALLFLTGNADGSISLFRSPDLGNIPYLLSLAVAIAGVIGMIGFKTVQ